jgi:GNAT superfamily N-acetyltransferase
MIRAMPIEERDTAIAPAESDAEIVASLPVMQGLHSQWTEPAAYLAQIRKQMAGGYHLVLLRWRGEVAACAGFRCLDMLTRGHFMQVDDFVTTADRRSQGLGEKLFAWLVAEARRRGCARIDLDSRMSRGEAHRFYFRQRMTATSLHFALPLTGIRNQGSERGIVTDS